MLRNFAVLSLMGLSMYATFDEMATAQALRLEGAISNEADLDMAWIPTESATQTEPVSAPYMLAQAESEAAAQMKWALKDPKTHKASDDIEKFK